MANGQKNPKSCISRASNSQRCCGLVFHEKSPSFSTWGERTMSLVKKVKLVSSNMNTWQYVTMMTKFLGKAARCLRTLQGFTCG